MLHVVHFASGWLAAVPQSSALWLQRFVLLMLVARLLHDLHECVVAFLQNTRAPQSSASRTSMLIGV